MRGRCEAHQLPAWAGHYRRSGWQWSRLREQVLFRDGSRCYLCGGFAGGVDHVVPVSQGGSDDPGNLAAVCDTCHGRKTAREAAAGRKSRRYGGRA